MKHLEENLIILILDNNMDGLIDQEIIIKMVICCYMKKLLKMIFNLISQVLINLENSNKTLIFR